jgi:chemotaxis protein MotA
MDMASFLGVLLGGVFFALAVAGAQGASLEALFDVPSLLLVAGGTLAAVLVSVPLRTVWNSLRACQQVFFNRQEDVAGLVRQMVALAETARRDGLLALEERLPAIADPFLALAVQMAVDGTRPEVLEDVLRTAMDAQAARHRNGKLVPEHMGRFAPAFGMIGTLVGLIFVLGNLSSPDALGPGMAAALITTLYGVLAANLFFLPFAEKLGYISRHELLARELVVRGILGIQAGDNPRVIEQKLSTFLPLGQGSGGIEPAEMPPLSAQKLNTLTVPNERTERRKAA